MPQPLRSWSGGEEGTLDKLTDEEMDDICAANTILVIDDEDDICNALTRLLAMEGYEVSVAGNGQEGLALAQRSKPDLVFVDLSLPDISGWDVAQTIKNANEQVKVILMTGWALPLIATEAGGRSVDFILRKPFDFDDVLDAVASLSVRE